LAYALASNVFAAMAFSLLNRVRRWKLNLSPAINKTPINPV
jgi:hypothetical protein